MCRRVRHWLTAVILLLCCGVALGAEDAPRFPVTYTLPRAAKVSLLLTDASGAVVRELLHGAPRARGKQTERWDGLDDQGQPVLAGTYRWKLLTTQGLQAEYLFTLGTNQQPTYARWPGNHNGVTAVAVDDTGIYFGTSCGEATLLAVKQDHAGKRLWEIPHNFTAWNGPSAMGVTSKGYLFMLERQGKLQRVDAGTGQYQAGWDILWTQEERQQDVDVLRTSLDLDARGEQVVISYAWHNALRWFDKETGVVIDEAAVPEPRGVGIGPDGRVYVISHDTVVSLTRRKKTPRTVITGLANPYRLAVDAQTGDLLISDKGPDWQVRRYSSRGTLLKTYGRQGGRRYGRYVATDFRAIDDLAALPNGRFLVLEPNAAPRRAAIITRDGAVERAWYGGYMYANYAAPDPIDPSLVWMSCTWGEQLQVKVDWVKHTWTPYAVYQYSGLANGLIGGGWSYFNWVIRVANGKHYLCRENDPAILEVDEANGRLMPRLVTFNAFVVWKNTRPPIITDAMTRGGFKENDSPFFLWTDRNGDGATTADEIRQTNGFAWGATPFIDEHLSYYKLTQTPAKDMTSAVLTYPLFGWKDGTPELGIDRAERPLAALSVNFAYPSSGPVGMTRDVDGSYLLAYLQNLNKERTQSIGKVVKCDRDGKLRWIVGQRADGVTAAPGETQRLYRVLSPVYGCAVVTDYADSMVHVWDQDGLWVGRLMDNPNLKVAPASAYAVGCENFGGATFVVPKGCTTPGLTPGEVLYFGCTANTTPVYRITGWDRFQRQSGSVTIPPAAAAHLKARMETEQARTDLVHISSIPGIRVDGDLADWKGVTPVTIRDGNNELARVYLAWKADGLYAAWDVTTTTPWKTSATQPQFAFQGGAAVELSLGPLMPTRTAGTAGDLRVVIAPLYGKATAVEMLPVLPVTLGAEKQTPVDYVTGLGKVRFARVAALPNTWTAARVRPDKSGYCVEARLPWYAPMLPKRGLHFRLDTAVLLANGEGTQVAARVPWHSQADADRIIHDTYTEASLRPQHWAEAVLEY